MKNLNVRNVLMATPLYLAVVLPTTYLSVRVLGEVWGTVFAGVANLILLLLLVRHSRDVQEEDS